MVKKALQDRTSFPPCFPPLLAGEVGADALGGGLRGHHIDIHGF